MSEKVKFAAPRRVQVVAPDPIGARYFKHGGSSDDGGMFWIDKPGCSKKGKMTYLISKSKDMGGGALWISADGVRFTSSKGAS